MWYTKIKQIIKTKYLTCLMAAVRIRPGCSKKQINCGHICDVWMNFLEHDRFERQTNLITTTIYFELNH